MKKITLFFIAMLFSISAMAQFTFDWTAQPISEGNNLKGMDVVNDTMAIVVGYGKTFVTSNDQGASWNDVGILDPEYDFGDISINSSGLGYACAGDVKVINNPTSGEPDVYADGLLLKTTDFGATWTVVDISELGPAEGDPTDYPNQVSCYANHFRAVEVLEDNSVILSMEWYYYESPDNPRVGIGGTLRSTDGTSWTALADSGYYSLAIEASPTKVFYGGLNHLFMADAASGDVTDLYDSLVVAEGGDETIFISDITAVSDNEVYVVTTSNGIHKISDSGNWFEKLDGTGVPTGGNDLIVVNDTTMLVLGTSSKSKITTDGGATWTGFYPGATCYEIGGIVNDTIIGLGKSNIYKCAVADAVAGNNTWISQEIKFNENMQKMHVRDANNAIIAGYGQTLVSTSDGGATWNEIALPELFVYGADYDFEDVSTIDTASYAISKRFYMVDYPSGSANADVFAHGLIYKSTDLWKSWELLDYNQVGAGVDPVVDPNADGAFGLDPMCLTMVNDTVVYMGARWLDSIGGYDVREGHSNVFRTEDGGDTWLPLFEDQGNRVFNNIHFLDEDTGFFLGNSFFRKTEDGGKTFTNMFHEIVETASPSDTAIFLKEIHYIDENNWYLLSSVDGVFVTADGGTSYSKLSGIGGGGGMALLDESSILVLGSSTKSKISWDAGQTWTDCYPGSTIWGIGGVLNGELVALAKSSLYKIPLVDLEAPSSDADVLTFALAEQTGDAVIDAVNHTVDIEVAEGTDPSVLNPAITVSEGATIDPASGAPQDFTNPVAYTVTAEDGEVSNVWTVTVTVYVAPSTEADILTFLLPEQTGDAVIDAVNHTVTIEVEEGTDPAALSPMITVSAGATITPSSLETQDFTSPVSYTVTAEDGATSLVWTATVNVEGVGFEMVTMDNIRIYPNPVKEKLYLENLEMVDNVSLISITGSSVLFINTPSAELEIDMTGIEGGIYFIKFTDIDGGVSTKKFVKE